MGELVWSAGYITDISDGIDSEDYKWRQGTTKRSKVYERGIAVEVLWDAVGGHEEETSIIPFMLGNWNKNKKGAWRLYFEY